jgi:C4-type Zn-finger protein
VSHFGDRLRYGDDCPVCGDDVKAVVENCECPDCGRVDGPRVYNGECSQTDTETGIARYIFHQ